MVYLSYQCQKADVSFCQSWRDGCSFPPPPPPFPGPCLKATLYGAPTGSGAPRRFDLPWQISKCVPAGAPSPPPRPPGNVQRALKCVTMFRYITMADHADSRSRSHARGSIPVIQIRRQSSSYRSCSATATLFTLFCSNATFFTTATTTLTPQTSLTRPFAHDHHFSLFKTMQCTFSRPPPAQLNTAQPHIRLSCLQTRRP